MHERPSRCDHHAMTETPTVELPIDAELHERLEAETANRVLGVLGVPLLAEILIESAPTDVPPVEPTA